MFNKHNTTSQITQFSSNDHSSAITTLQKTSMALLETAEPLQPPHVLCRALILYSMQFWFNLIHSLRSYQGISLTLLLSSISWSTWYAALYQFNTSLCPFCVLWCILKCRVKCRLYHGKYPSEIARNQSPSSPHAPHWATTLATSIYSRRGGSSAILYVSLCASQLWVSGESMGRFRVRAAARQSRGV